MEEMPFAAASWNSCNDRLRSCILLIVMVAQFVLADCYQLSFYGYTICHSNVHVKIQISMRLCIQGPPA